MDFKTFVKKYSFVESEFIDDFYNIFREDYIEKYNKFLIDSELLRNLLKINNKTGFNNTIKKSYVKNIDYKIKTLKRTKKSHDQDVEIIILTPKTAKKICLSTNSKKGKEAQQYFIDLEFALYKYKNYIIDALKQKHELLLNNIDKTKNKIIKLSEKQSKKKKKLFK